MTEIKMDEKALCYEYPECGAEGDPGQTYCQECGEPLEWKED